MAMAIRSTWPTPCQQRSSQVSFARILPARMTGRCWPGNQQPAGARQSDGLEPCPTRNCAVNSGFLFSLDPLHDHLELDFRLLIFPVEIEQIMQWAGNPFE